MQPLDLVTIFTRRLDETGIAYFVTGSVASLLYGEPRMTHDVDLVLTLTDPLARSLIDAFPEEDFYVPPLDVMRLELRRPSHGHFNLIHHDTGFKADIYLAGRDPLHAWAMTRKKRVGEAPTAFWVAPPEYVIIRKLAWYREGRSEKHLRDIRGMLEVSQTELDQVELERWLGALGLQREWQTLNDSR